MAIGLQCFICVFLVMINKVSPQVTVEGVIGGSVVLPCLSTKVDLQPQDINVHWRHNESTIVCEIIKGKDVGEVQDPQYKNRVESFREYYLRGNFSIKLKDLQQTDTGDFSCFIIYAHDHKTVQLIIKEPRTKEKRLNTNGNGDDDVEEPSTLPVVSILIAVIIIAVIIFIIIYKRKKLNLQSCFCKKFIPVSTVSNN